MAVLLIDVTDAVVAELVTGLAASAFSRSFEPYRIFDAMFELTDSDLHVEVMPAGIEIDAAARDAFAYDVSVDVFIRQKIQRTGEQEDNEIEGLLELEEEIARYLTADDANTLTGKRLASMAAAVSSGHAEIRVPYIPRHLREWRQFTGIVTATYQVFQ